MTRSSTATEIPADTELIDHVLARVRAAPILQDPFPHLLIEGLIPQADYQRILAGIPRAAEFDRVVYPGTGFDAAAAAAVDHGLALQDLRAIPALSDLDTLFRSEAFQRTLLERFSAPGSWAGHGSAIPVAKHAFFTGGNRDVATVLALHKDLPGYSISPHRDVDEKIVTFLYYLEPDHALAAWGTLLCKPRQGLSLEAIECAPGFGGQRRWRDWALFDVAKTAPATPNTLLVFAPNANSYHAVRLDIPIDHPRRERTVLRGFIRAGASRSNWIAPAEYGAAKRLRWSIGRAGERGARALRRLADRALFHKRLDAAVISFGGAGTTMLLDFLRPHLKVNHRNSFKDGLKHLGSPSHPALRRFAIRRAIYIYADPREAAMSLFRRDYAFEMMAKLTAQHRSAKEYGRLVRAFRAPVDDLQSFVARGEDLFDFAGHWQRWHDEPLPFPVMFVRYDALHDSLPAILDFLGLPGRLAAEFPPRRERSSRLADLDAALRDGLDAIYGPLAEELAAMPPVSIRQPSGEA